MNLLKVELLHGFVSGDLIEPKMDIGASIGTHWAKGARGVVTRVEGNIIYARRISDGYVDGLWCEHVRRVSPLVQLAEAINE